MATAREQLADMLGSAAIMAEQCGHLAIMAERPDIGLHVIPEGTCAESLVLIRTVEEQWKTRI
jgi:hypothetical protein